jgi:hypothetical protein
MLLMRQQQGTAPPLTSGWRRLRWAALRTLYTGLLQCAMLSALPAVTIARLI